MADKDNDEEKFEDDEDFGLPELHYEELDDDDSSSKEEEDKSQDTPEEPSSDPFTDQDSTESDDSADSSEETFYEEESFDEFKEDSGSTSTSVFDSDDTPEPDAVTDSPEPETFGEDAFAQTDATTPYTAYYSEDSAKSAKSNFTKIVIIGTLLFASIAIVFVFMMDGGGFLGLGGEEKKSTPPPPKPVVDTTAVDSSAFQPVEREPVKPQPTKQTPGTINTLEQRTGKSYVVIGSFFDGDLAMDYAKALAQNGNSPKIIPPFRDYRFYRVAIAEFNSFKEAEAQAPSYAEQFGREAWPLKY